MNKRRLLKLAEFLETAKLPGKFDLSFWAQADGVRNGRPACGTVACAIGWATTVPSFRRAGLAMLDKVSPEPEYRGWQGWSAVTAFFDIPGWDAEHLFSALKYPISMTDGIRGRRAVAKRIREFVESAP